MLDFPGRVQPTRAWLEGIHLSQGDFATASLRELRPRRSVPFHARALSSDPLERKMSTSRESTPATISQFQLSVAEGHDGIVRSDGVILNDETTLA